VSASRFEAYLRDLELVASAPGVVARDVAEAAAARDAVLAAAHAEERRVQSRWQDAGRRLTDAMSRWRRLAVAEDVPTALASVQPGAPATIETWESRLGDAERDLDSAQSTAEWLERNRHQLAEYERLGAAPSAPTGEVAG
jgi:hypothetical protein